MTDLILPWFSLLISVGLPALVALATKRFAASGAKAVVLAALAAVTGLLTELYSAVSGHTAFHWNAACAYWATAFVVAVASHYGLLKPVGVTGTDGSIARATPALGVGSPQHADNGDQVDTRSYRVRKRQ